MTNKESESDKGKDAPKESVEEKSEPDTSSSSDEKIQEKSTEPEQESEQPSKPVETSEESSTEEKPEGQSVDQTESSEKNEEPPVTEETEEETSAVKPAEDVPQPASSEPVETKASKKKAPKTEKPVEGGDEADDFLYIVRIANTDIDGKKRVIHGLTQIKGIGHHLAFIIADKAGLDQTKKMGDLTEKEIASINAVLEDIPSNAPSWMMNHRKDYDTGEDIHLISADVTLRLRDDINLLKMIRSYRGIRHESNLPVRGQRTRANGRFGLSMGVSRKSVQNK